MIDINLLNDETFREKLKQSEKKRFKNPELVDEVYMLYKEKKNIQFFLEGINKKINTFNDQMKNLLKDNSKGNSKDNSKDNSNQVENLTKDMILLNLKENKEKQNETKEKLVKIEEKIETLLKNIGNLVDDRVVVSKDESNNKIIRQYRTKRVIKSKAHHNDVMVRADGLDMKRGSKIAGHRGYFLEGKIALLSNALSKYAIDFALERGYKLSQVPMIIKKDIIAKGCQLSDFDDQLYSVEGDLCLIATSEHSLVSKYSDERISPKELPKKYVGQSFCFRKEAGAHGKNNLGIFRVHQFEKIEQFVICAPEDSEDFFEKMVEMSEEFYRSLDISYNVVGIVSGELNDAAAIKYDIECHFPHSNTYRELVSVSNCTDYQSRELEVRYGLSKIKGEKAYVHMLNGTLCAVQRALCCIVENYQEEEGIRIPDVLVKYMNMSFIPFVNDEN